MKFSTSKMMALLGLASMQFSSVFAATVKIMPLGDSITGNPGCWRATLYNGLVAAGGAYADIDMVGTLDNSGHCGVPFDGGNEGHGGYLATGIADQNQLVPWLAATNPDIVMMMLGTNDVWSAKSPATITTAFSKLVDQMRANNPKMKILVAQILPMTPSGCNDCNDRVRAFNAVLPDWATSKGTADSPITVVDHFSGINTSTDTGDGVHPNESGSTKIANKWYPYLKDAIDAVRFSNGVPTTSKTATATATPPPSTTNTNTPTSTATQPSSPYVPTYGQCGGKNHTGGKTCTWGVSCVYINEWYSQCIPN
ncbi:SGNH hydrolase [Ascobolus immersus RN42]|uniref:SGNH hydrolase n=1 Tax=Ascobolus immersus RN42 TaxID=1160509 RepID=A0A3N4HA16_ASCIM|nr:SGNH hydrolase [Ascobolus immersus RN42]